MVLIKVATGQTDYYILINLVVVELTPCEALEKESESGH